MSSDQEILKRVLLLRAHPDVRLLDGSLRIVTARAALLMVKNGLYDWCGTLKRVRKMRPAGPPAPRWIPCYRTTCAAVLPPSPEWLASRR